MDENISVNDDFDVVIVGAGLTGLTAAYSILKRCVGLKVLILEGNDTVGGRILLEKDSQAFYAGFYQERILTLINELDILMEKGGDAKRLDFFTRDGSLPKKMYSFVSGQVYHFLKLLQRFSTDSRYLSDENHESNKDLAEISIKRFMHRTVYSSQARLLCESLLYACCGIENLEKVSALWFIVMLHGAGGCFRKLSASLGDEDRFFLNGGFEFLVKKLEEKINEEGGSIGCSKIVLNIETIGERIMVSTSSIRFKCEYVIIAVPPPSSSLITVEPDLPRPFLESQSLYEPGKNAFFHATYRESSWPSDSSDCMISTADSGTILRITYDATHPVDRKIRTLAGFTSSKSSDEYTPRSTVLRALKKCFGTSKFTRCIGYSVADWTIGNVGSPMSVLRPCSIKYHVNPTNLPLERVFFAASEYAKKWPGTADGAVEAGETAAYSILFRARPQALDRDQSRRYSDSRRKYVPERPPGIVRAHLICLGLNVCLFFFLLRDSYESTSLNEV